MEFYLKITRLQVTNLHLNQETDRREVKFSIKKKEQLYRYSFYQLELN